VCVSSDPCQKSEYVDEEQKKVTAYRVLLEEYEMKRHDGFMNAQDTFEQFETLVKPEIIQDIYFDRLKQSPLQQQQRLHGRQQEESGTEELSAEYLNAVENSLQEDEYGNDTIRVSAHYAKNKTGKLNEITTGMKEIYKALRSRDSNIDDSFDVKVVFPPSSHLS
jgi:hypothetical protein